MARLARLVVLSALCFVAPSPCLLSQLQPAPATQPAQPAAQPESSNPSTPAIAPSPEIQPDPAAEPSVTADQPTAAATTQKDDKKKVDDHKPIAPSDVHRPVMWHDPGNIAAKDLFHGPGGKDGLPAPPFQFLDEDKHDSNPKFDVRDAKGRKWRVKLGAEARPEVVATRLLWAVGYYTDDDYNVHVASIRGLHTSRGKRLIHNGNQIVDARFGRKPDGEKRIAAWAWKSNPFFGTREFNGLRVMMALLNNWDLKDENNAVYSDKKTGRQIFLVSDTGATFGANSLRIKNVNGKGNVEKYQESKFITNETDKDVNFGTPAPPTDVLMESGGVMTSAFFRRKGYDWIGDHIPRTDARWIGNLLGQLTHDQLVDAFRAGNFTPEETDVFVDIVEKRIAQLKTL